MLQSPQKNTTRSLPTSFRTLVRRYRGANFSLEATLNIWCQRKNHVGSKLPKVLLNTKVVCCLTVVKSLKSVFCRVPIFGSILSISLQQIEYEKIYAVHLNQLVESYTLIPVTIFINKYWGAKISNSSNF